MCSTLIAKLLILSLSLYIHFTSTQFNILYVGGRPGTKLFRLRGTVENLIVITAPIQEDIIMNLHRQGLDGTVTLEPPTSHYCYQYKSVGEACIVGDEDLNDNDFRYVCT